MAGDNVDSNVISGNAPNGLSNWSGKVCLLVSVASHSSAVNKRQL